MYMNQVQFGGGDNRSTYTITMHSNLFPVDIGLKIKPPPPLGGATAAATHGPGPC